MKVLSLRALEGLRAYKYKSGGYTWMDHLHTPIWNWITERLPMWLSANLITLSGLIPMIVSYFLMWYYLPEFTGEAPRWMYYLSGVSVILYTNLDCIDGKQARRTRSSSPLGQLFDHGCDALSLHVLLGLIQSCVDHPCNYIATVSTAGISTPWLLSHWEEYHTGMLMYGNGYIGVLEANYLLAVAAILTGVVGPRSWARPLGSIMPYWPSWAHPELELKHLICIASILSGVVVVAGQVNRVFTGKAAVLTEAERGHKELGATARLKHLAYCALLLLGGIVWLADSDTKPAGARLAALAYGLIYASVATQLIMDHMSKEPFRPQLHLMAMLLFGASNSVFKWFDTRVVAAALAAATLLYYVWYVTTIVGQLCAFLGIPLLTIKHKPRE